MISLYLVVALGVISAAGTMVAQHRSSNLGDDIEVVIFRDRARHTRITGAASFSLSGELSLAWTYYAKVALGSPLQEFHVQIDTGSDLSWISCTDCTGCPNHTTLLIRLNYFNLSKSSTGFRLTCSDYDCSCSTGSDVCTYSADYFDGSKGEGYLMSDVLGLGMASALETLCGQAYGAKQYHMLGIYLQRSWIVLSVCAVCILPLFILATPLLKALGQDKVIAGVAGTVSMWFIPGIFSFIASFTWQMYLQAQSKNKIISYLAAFSLSVHLLLSWLLTVKFKFGLSGAMVSTVVAYWIPNLGQFAFIFLGGCPETYKGFSILAFKDLLPVVKLSLSSGAMLCLELWYYTILVLLTGNMENSEVAIDALSICLNINGWEMMTSLGFLAAASVRVSNELGRGSSKDARFAIMNIVLTSLAIGFVLFVFFLFFRENLAYIFTNNPEAAAAVADLSPLLATSILLNSVQPVLSGVAIGAGLQSTVAYVNIASYYVIGVPAGLILGYQLGLHVKGVWMGLIFGTFVQTIILVLLTYRTDWENQALERLIA